MMFESIVIELSFEKGVGPPYEAEEMFFNKLLSQRGGGTIYTKVSKRWKYA
jgi:hypothetical protein